MAMQRKIPGALTVAGSDSGGGAGIQADLNTFAALGIHGTSVVTCITAQNPKRVIGIQACTTSIVRDQLEAVFEELPPAAVKTGMLYSAALIRAVSDFLAPRRPLLVVDPVMVSTSGAQLLKPAAVAALCSRLLPMATVVTPNVDEAEILTRRTVCSVEDLRVTARELHSRFGCAALVKGGHLRGLTRAVDIFFDGHNELLLEAAFVRGVSTHGTGCTYSAAITGYLACGKSLLDAVTLAKNYITNAISESRSVGRHSVLNWASAGR